MSGGTPAGTSAAPDTSFTRSLARALAWVGPFVVFALWLLLDKYVPLANPWRELLRDAVLVAATAAFSLRVLPTSAPRWIPSIAFGIGVFAVWIAPDLLVPGWRSHPLFQNTLTGHLRASILPAERTPLMLALRTARAALIVPVVEELFWRGWLPRWIQNPRFERVPLGRYTPFAFWATAILFATEHGPFWEVGLLAGVAYNWWMRRTRSLGDVMVAHAATNLALSLYVIATQRWTYWM